MKLPLALRVAALIGTALFPACALADSVGYHFTLDTSSIQGTSGYLDMQFWAWAAVSGGGGTAYNTTASAVVSDFNTNGLLGSEDPYTATFYGSPEAFGDISGTLPGGVTFSVLGDGATNDYSQQLTFGTNLSFDLTLSGQGVTTPLCPVNQGGAVCTFPDFELDLYDANGNYLLTNSASGVVGGIQLNADATTTPFLNPAADGGPSALDVTPLAATPEPSSLLLMGSGIIILFVARSRMIRERTALG